jgi:hypothetical protein
MSEPPVVSGTFLNEGGKRYKGRFYIGLFRINETFHNHFDLFLGEANPWTETKTMHMIVRSGEKNFLPLL